MKAELIVELLVVHLEEDRPPAEHLGREGLREGREMGEPSSVCLLPLKEDGKAQ